MPDNPSLLIEKLNFLLDEERSILLSGELGDLPIIAAKKEELLAELSTAELNAEAGLEPMQKKVVENHELLKDALASIRSVAERLAKLREASGRGAQTPSEDPVSDARVS